MAPRRRQQLADILGPLETEVMEVVWQRGEATVREVHDTLRRVRPVAYTTVMTTMGRLAEKGLLRREEEQPAYQYSPLVSRAQYERSTVKSVVDWLMSHFRDPAVAYFLDKVEKEDQRVIASLKQAIEERESKR
ncbi:MAG: BlaI/MecI/CopY family transcriptional regulator [Actinomycetota bacterium]